LDRAGVGVSAIGLRSAAFLVAGLMATAPHWPALGSERAAVARFDWPAAGRVIISMCGDPRDGLNMALPPGAPIHAVERGVVAYAGDRLKGFGNVILIRHPDGWASAYAQLGRMRVERNDRVERGQTIATAPGVDSDDPWPFHFELRRKSEQMDPLPYLVGGGIARTPQTACAGQPANAG
jgi:murein DD-endopeptidase MepM/ murein hydrolase activator NlpD